MTLGQRHRGEEVAILTQRKTLYEAAKAAEIDISKYSQVSEFFTGLCLHVSFGEIPTDYKLVSELEHHMHN